MIDTTIQRTFFVLLLFLVTLAFLWLIRGFLQPIFWAAALAIVFYPIQDRIGPLLRGRRSLASALSVLLAIVVVILPLGLVAAAVTSEAAMFYQRLTEGDIDLGRIYAGLEQRIPQLTDSLAAVGIDLSQVREGLSGAAVNVSRFIANQAMQLGQNTLRVTVMFFLMLYLLFFFLRDGHRILDGLVRALPLGDGRERQLLARFAEVSRATIKGTLVIGIVQGTIGGITFSLLGLTAPVLWGVVMALASLLPAVGPALVWVPAAIYLLTTGQWIAGAVLIAVGVLIIGLVDNVLRPILVGRDTRLPDYLVLLATLGGLAGFGLAGIVIGPIIAAFFLSVWEMAEQEFVQDD